MKKIAGINIKNGHCVHLGDNENNFMVYENDPIAFSKALEADGADKLHIVDIDGVFSGQTNMLPLLKSIKESVSIPIQFGGGIRNYETATKLLEMGLDIVLGTVAILNQDLLIQLLDEYPQQVIVAADVYENVVYIEGWEENSSTELEDFIHTLELLNVQSIMITDIARSGDNSNHESCVKLFASKPEITFILSTDLPDKASLNALDKMSLNSVVIQAELFKSFI